MKLARYIGSGQIEIQEEALPVCPQGGLVVKTEASGLCSGELMDWYMDRKIPHVLGHEVSGIVIESHSEEFPVGSRVFVHHHAPCLACEACLRRAYVHCSTWKSTKLRPGGMAEYFAVVPDNLTDTIIVDDLRPQEVALIEPLACVVKCLWRMRYQPGQSGAVVGLGVMGLLHLLLMPGAVGYDLNPLRREWAQNLGLEVGTLAEHRRFEKVVVCPGTAVALDWGLNHLMPQGTLGLFAPLPPGEAIGLDLEKFYFEDINLVASYSCGPDDTMQAVEILRAGLIRAEQVVSHFISLDELPAMYQEMKSGRIVKPMVQFG